ncbi:MAG: methylmalonyl-CoA decarboxylase [Thermodesulfobacteriota bacterium]
MPPVNELGTAKDLINCRIQENIGTVIINDRDKANCLSSPVLRGLLQAFDRFEQQKVRVVIIRAYPGAKIWSAGHDLREIQTDGSDPLPYDEPFEQVLHRVVNCPAPVIGMIEGSVWGGACDLAMTCDILVGTPAATFAITPAKIGIAYNTAGLNHFIGAVPIHVIKEMLFTANPISAQDAYRLGLLNRLVEAEKLEETTMDIARTIAARAPLVVSLMKKEIRKLTGGKGLTPDEFEELQSLRRQTYRSNDFKEGVKAFFEKRPPTFTGE